MKAVRESIQLAAPLRDVKLARSGDREALRQQDLQASFERGRQEGERALGEQLIRQRAEVKELQTGVLAWELHRSKKCMANNNLSSRHKRGV
jgi:hypothetical protein